MATQKQQKAIENVVENGGNVSKAMRDANYSPMTAKNPKKLTESAAWQKLMKKAFSDRDLAQKHKELMDATRLDHMVFPTALTDGEITELLKGVNCTVRKFMHSDSGTHCWFWSYDNKARKEALDMAYKLKGKYSPEKKELNLGEEDREVLKNILDSIRE